MNSPYIFDAIFILILIFMFWRGKKRGAIRVIKGLFGTVAAWVMASSLSPTVTPVTIRLVTPYAVRLIGNTADAMGLTSLLDSAVLIGQGVSQASNSLLTLSERLAAIGMPSQISELAEGLKVSGTLERILPSLSGSVTPEELLTQALVLKIAPVITFFVIFTAIKLAISLVSRLLSINWPIFGSLNHLAGGLIGLAGGAVIVLAICAGIFTYGTREPAGLTSAAMLSQSIIGGFLAPFMAK